MNFKLLSHNVRGLNEGSSVPTLRNYVQSIGQLYVLYIQEHKLRGKIAAQLGRKLWPQAHCWSLEANPGYAFQTNGASKSGIATLLAPRWVHLVSNSGMLSENRAHCFILTRMPGGDLGVVNIYAPNKPASRIRLWQEMIDNLPTTCRWIFTGDFNNVENWQDKTNVCGRLMSNGERLVFQALKKHFQVHDNPRFSDNARFSWDNFRANRSLLLGF